MHTCVIINPVNIIIDTFVPLVTLALLTYCIVRANNNYTSFHTIHTTTYKNSYLYYEPLITYNMAVVSNSFLDLFFILHNYVDYSII